MLIVVVFRDWHYDCLYVSLSAFYFSTVYITRMYCFYNLKKLLKNLRDKRWIWETECNMTQLGQGVGLGLGKALNLNPWTPSLALEHSASYRRFRGHLCGSLSSTCLLFYSRDSAGDSVTLQHLFFMGKQPRQLIRLFVIPYLENPKLLQLVFCPNGWTQSKLLKGSVIAIARLY